MTGVQLTWSLGGTLGPNLGGLPQIETSVGEPIGVPFEFPEDSESSLLEVRKRFLLGKRNR